MRLVHQPTTTHAVDFKAAVRAETEPTGRTPRVARVLALAHKIDGMIRVGELRDLADAARTLGLTRARVTQVVSLLLLAPEIQEAVLDLPLVTNGRDPISERQLRKIVAEPIWGQQVATWFRLSPIWRSHPEQPECQS